MTTPLASLVEQNFLVSPISKINSIVVCTSYQFISRIDKIVPKNDTAD
jgi:hypothetical protein